MKTCCIVSLEGPDSQGKSTHAKKLLNYLESVGFRAVYIKSPDHDSFFFNRIYGTLESGWATKHPILFQMMQFANKMHFQHSKLPQLRNQVDVIIMDRWDVSMQAYGLATGVPPVIIRVMSKMLVKPSQVFLLSGNKSIREAPRDVYESDNSLQKAVSTFYNSGVWRNQYQEVTDIQVADDPDDTFKLILEKFRF
jgi:thymidylate kinase